LSGMDMTLVGKKSHELGRPNSLDAGILDSALALLSPSRHSVEMTDENTIRDQTAANRTCEPGIHKHGGHTGTKA